MFRKTLLYSVMYFKFPKMNHELLALYRLRARYELCNRNLFLNSLYRKSDTTKAVAVVYDYFENVENKNKETFLDFIHIYEGKGPKRRGHVEFIYKALKHMKDFGVDKDLEVYKALIDVLPKGKFIPTNIFQAEFQHYPKQQQCIIDVLEQMEENGVMPDPDLEIILLNIFGKRGHPVRKYWRMMYWMPKFKNLSPWPLPKPVPNDALELAKLALERMSSVDLQSKVSVFQTSELKDILDHTWIVSAQSPIQKELLDAHPQDIPVFVEGPFRIYLREESVNYFVLRTDPRPRPAAPTPDPDDISSLKFRFFQDPAEPQALVQQPTVHEQEDGTVFAMCATGTSSRNSLLSWIRFVEADGNPALAMIPVLFKLKSSLGEVPAVTTESKNQSEMTERTTQDKH